MAGDEGCGAGARVQQQQCTRLRGCRHCCGCCRRRRHRGGGPWPRAPPVCLPSHALPGQQRTWHAASRPSVRPRPDRAALVCAVTPAARSTTRASSTWPRCTSSLRTNGTRWAAGWMVGRGCRGASGARVPRGQVEPGGQPGGQQSTAGGVPPASWRDRAPASCLPAGGSPAVPCRRLQRLRPCPPRSYPPGHRGDPDRPTLDAISPAAARPPASFPPTRFPPPARSSR